MTYVQIGSIHNDGFKNVKKNQNGIPLPWKPTKISEKGQKMSSRRSKYLEFEK